MSKEKGQNFPKRGDEFESDPYSGSRQDGFLDEGEDYPESFGDTRPAESKSQSSSGALARRDPLAVYLNEIGKYEILTPEEEYKLAVRYKKTGDPAVAFKLVTSNLALVVKIAFEYRRSYIQILDLIQEGNIGLMQAVKKFDPYKGVRLPSYAQYWIRAYILRFLLANFRLVKIGTSEEQRKIFYNLKKERDKLIKEGFEPTTKLLAARMEVSEEQVEAMSGRLYASDVSLDAPVADDASATISDFIPSDGATPEEETQDAQLKEIIRAKIEEFQKTLKKRELEFWKKRIIAEEPITLQELADKYKISRERARQVDEILRKKFKKFLEKNMDKATIKDLYSD
ncbi:MAG: RNA polymerase factor sigma-32 [Myxococcota bacterium]